MNIDFNNIINSLPDNLISKKEDVTSILTTPSNSADNQQDKVLISDLQTDLEVSIINSIANLLLYRETFPISSILYEKIEGKYIKESIKEEYKNFNIINILSKITEKLKELKKKLENEKYKKDKKIEEASALLIKANIEKLKNKKEKDIINQKERLKLFYMIAGVVYNFITSKLPIFTKYFIDKIASFIHSLFTTLNTNWSNVFAGFAIIGSFIILVTFLSSNNKSDNNKSSRRNSSSTTENNFGIPDFQLKINNMFADFNSFTKRMNDNATAVSETISSVTTATPDDITRIKLDNGRGADNLYHFNGKDLNKMNFKKGIYDENSVYSIYKPIDIKIKDFDIKWKSEKEENNNKYVFDCEDTSMKDYFDKDCTARTYDIIVTDKDNICVEPI
jgi:hypothetical protein